GFLQMLSNLMYIAQVWAGHDVSMLAFAIGAENLTGGRASAAFVAYLSGLCNIAFTATHYALLSSLATVGINLLSASGGALAQHLGWVPFFALSTVLCLPGLALLLWVKQRAESEARGPVSALQDDNAS
ncbi:MAG: MFS transporter, partial [Acetobacteraceae bacterium]|nr:MFS transporter [Acetobacteraceae bacterium]